MTADVTSRGPWFTLFLAVFLVVPTWANAADGIGVFFTPSVGYSWFKLKALEIDESFIRPPDEQLDGEDIEDLDFSDAKRSVGATPGQPRPNSTVGGALTT